MAVQIKAMRDPDCTAAGGHRVVDLEDRRLYHLPCDIQRGRRGRAGDDDQARTRIGNQLNLLHDASIDGCLGDPANKILKQTLVEAVKAIDLRKFRPHREGV
jgi:hypothetical protein